MVTSRGSPLTMLAWEPVVEARALHARGWTISAIARHLQINRRTVRRYLSGEVGVGKRRPAGLDGFERFVGWAKVWLRAAAKIRPGRGQMLSCPAPSTRSTWIDSQVRAITALPASPRRSD